MSSTPTRSSNFESLSIFRTGLAYPYNVMFWIACMGHLCVDFMIGIWPVYKTMVQMDLGVAGAIAGVSALLAESLQPIFGAAADRKGRLWFVGLGLIFACVTAFIPFFTSAAFLFLVVLLTCLGSSMFHPAGAGLCGSLTANHKGKLITIFAACGALGMATSQIVFQCCYKLVQEWVALLAVFPILLGVVGWFYSSTERAKAFKAPTQSHYAFSGLVRLLKNNRIRALYFSQVFNASLFWGMLFLLPDVLVTKGYVEWFSLGGGHFCFVIGGALMMIPAGILSDRFSPSLILLASCFLSAISFFIFLISPALSIPFAIITILFMGAVMGLINPVAISLGNKLAPESPALVSALLMGLVWCISELLGTAGAGFLATLFETDAPVKALMVLGTLFFASLFCYYRLFLLERTPRVVTVQAD